MGRRSEKARSKTLPSSPSHSSSSSDFEFTISASPRKTSAPADELFYKGQLLPLHQSPRLSMVRTLLLANSSSTSSSSTASDPRDSTGSSTDSTSSFSSDLALLTAAVDCDSSRPSPVEEHQIKKCNKYYYFPLSRFSSVFKKENKNHRQVHDSTVVTPSSSSIKRTAREVIRKYLKKVKPLYEKLSLHKQPQQQKMAATTATMSFLQVGPARDATELARSSLRSVDNSTRGFSHSFSGNLRYPRRKSCVSSCPSSMRSSPSHSGVLSRSVVLGAGRVAQYSSDMDELQSAIQGAIAHCKNSMMQKTNTIDRSVIKEILRTN